MSSHVDSKKLYFGIFGALMLLTALTIQAAFINLGPLNNVVAMTIAVIKATLVVLFFMHVRHANRLTKMVVAAGFLWLLILFVFTLSDFVTRGWLPYPGK